MSGKHSRNELKGVWIPGDVLRDPQISHAGKILMAEILALHQNASGCYCSNAHLADILGLSISGVRKHLAKLIEDGYLERGVIEMGHAQIRTLCPKRGTPLSQTEHPPAQIGTPKRTDNKTTIITKEGHPKSLDQVLNAFHELGHEEEAEKFWNHYEANGWVQGKNKPIRDWKAAARQWIARAKKWNNEKKGFNPEGWNGNGVADFLRNG